MFAIHDLQTFHAGSVDVIIVSPHTKFHIPGFSGPLDIPIKKLGNSSHCRHVLVFLVGLRKTTKTDVTAEVRIKKTPWLWSASEQCRPSDRRLLAK
jgi:hypothetical protein